MARKKKAFKQHNPIQFEFMSAVCQRWPIMSIQQRRAWLKQQYVNAARAGSAQRTTGGLFLDFVLLHNPRWLILSHEEKVRWMRDEIRALRPRNHKRR